MAVMNSLVSNNTSQKAPFVGFGYTSDNSNLHTSYIDTFDLKTNKKKSLGKTPVLSPENYIYILQITGFNQNIASLFPSQNDEDFNLLIADAVKRYKELNNALDYDTSLAASFLSLLKTLCHTHYFRPYIIFTQFGAKAEFDFNNKHFVFDYEYDDPDSIVLLCNEAGELNTKECSLNELESAFEAF
jgi:hypothetical protein